MSVSRGLAVGGDSVVRGSMTVGHNLRVEGWLDAPNVKDANKGLFASVEALRAAYPLPQDGWWALVGESVPADVWRAEDGAWVRTGGQGGTPSIDVSQFLAAALAAVDGATARFSAVVDGGAVVRQTSTTAGGEVVYVRESDVFAYRLNGVLYSDWQVEGVASADLFMDDARAEKKRDKLYVCGDTAYMVSTEGQLLALAHYSALSELLLRIQGTSEESSAETDPFVSLGVFTGDDVWTQVKAALDGLVISEEVATHRWAGLCRLSVDGARVEVVNFPLDYASQQQVQVMTGCVASADGVTLARGDWQQLVRSHTSSGGWTRWQAAVQGRTDFAGLNAIADAENYASAGNAACDVRSWAVVAPHGGREVAVGRLWQLSDSMGHQLTQVLLTHHEPGEDGSFGAHTDGKVHLWKRSYGLLQGSADCAPIGAWTAWTDLLAVPVELDERMTAQERALEDVASTALAASSTANASLPAVFDAVLAGPLSIQQSSTTKPQRIVYSTADKRFCAQSGLSYYFSWAYGASLDGAHRDTAAYNVRGKTYLCTGTGQLYVMAVDGSLLAVAGGGGGDEASLDELKGRVDVLEKGHERALAMTFDGVVDLGLTPPQEMSVGNPERIVYNSRSQQFSATKDGKTYALNWTYTEADGVHESRPSYAGTDGHPVAGKLFFDRVTGKYYANLGDGGLTEVLRASEGADEERLSELEDAVWPTQASLTASKTLLEYTGAEQAVTLSWNVRRKGAAVTVSSLTVTQSKGSGEQTQVYSGKENPGTAEAKVNFYGQTSFALSAKVGSKSYAASAKVQMVLPVYAGFAAAASGVGIASLTKQGLRTSAAGTYSLTNEKTGNYLWLCVPATMTVKRVTLNGFDVPMEAAADGETTLGAYKCYRSSNQLAAQAFTFVVA